jgi:hypothetical protein
LAVPRRIRDLKKQQDCGLNRVQKSAEKGTKNMATPSFKSTIQPFFTPCYRSHMIKVMSLDLWDAGQVQDSWDDINSAVASGSMPKPGCPEGVWDKPTQQLFLSDFLAWKNAGYPP